MAEVGELTALSLYVDDSGKDPHVLVVLTSYLLEALEDRATFGDPSDEDVVDAALYLSGVLARLAVEALPWLALSVQNHGCGRPVRIESTGTPRVTNGCGISICPSLFTGVPDIDAAVALHLEVPRSEAQNYLERIGKWLAVIERYG